MVNMLLNILYSVYFNFKYLPLKTALKMPILINHNVNIRKLNRGNLLINNMTPTLGMIRFGIDKGSFCLAKKQSSIYVEDDCELIFNGRCSIDGGFSLTINMKGKISIGHNVHFNANAIISSSSLIKVDDNVGTGWDCTLINWDGHDIIDIETQNVINLPRPIIINKNCWIGAKVTIMKGVVLSMNTIVPYGSILTKKCDVSYCVFGGTPNRVLKTNVARTDKM